MRLAQTGQAFQSDQREGRRAGGFRKAEEQLMESRVRDPHQEEKEKKKKEERQAAVLFIFVP